MSLSTLPIDEHLERAAHALQGEKSALVVEAPPGAGKTTRLPAHLLAENWCHGQVLVSEPRRIAARLAATRVAEERGVKVADEVGYQVRFDDKTSDATRLVYLTEGLLLRRILEAPDLPGVSAIVLDEVHERSADLDIVMALLKKVRLRRPDLRLVLMSATLDAAPLQAYFKGAQLLTSAGRSYEVELEHQPKEDDRKLEIQVRSAVKEALTRDGDILVFLPGGAEIRACQKALEKLSDLEVLPLHGDLPLQEQVRAVRKGSRRRRVVLSTNVAESSVTIPDVTTVIDSGLARTAVFDHWSGVTRLETTKISQARCIQRAGRAGRVAPGRAIRLFTKGSFVGRTEHDTPELLRNDLSSILLMLGAAGLRQEELPLLSAPPPSSWKQARQFLENLGAWHDERPTEIGIEMAQLPVPPRLARVAVEGKRLGLTAVACRAAALLAERDILLSTRGLHSEVREVELGDSDLDDRLDRLAQLEDSGFDRREARDLNVDLRGAKQAVKVARSLERILSRSNTTPPEDALSRCLLSGFLDRVAEKRGKGDELVTASGLQARLHQTSCVQRARYLIALAADAPGGKRRQAQVRLACRLEADWLLEAAPDQVEPIDECVWNSEKERIDQVSRLSFGRVTLDESRSRATPSEEGAELLKKAALAKGAAVYDPESQLETLFVRLSLLTTQLPELLDRCTEEEQKTFNGLQEEGEWKLSRLVDLALQTASLSRTSLEELAQARLAQELESFLPSSISQALAQELPHEIMLKGGRRLPVHYEIGKDPWIESRLQDFFSMTETPCLCSGRLPLALHLLAPNKRAVQVTSDLPGFWERHYPDLRKQLMRRYPKHLWPEDGRTAKPPQPGRIR